LNVRFVKSFLEGVCPDGTGLAVCELSELLVLMPHLDCFTRGDLIHIVHVFEDTN